MVENSGILTPEQKISIISIATKFQGRLFPINHEGINAALSALEQQHARVMFRAQRAEILQMVEEQDGIIRFTEMVAAHSLGMQDFGAALAAGNHLHAFAQVEREEGIEGIASPFSVRTHRALATRVRDEFGLIDPYLRRVGAQVFADAESLRASGDVAKEEHVLRRVVHMTALNQTLGRDAKHYFDPYALIVK